MTYLNSLTLDIGAMSNTRIVLSCNNYSFESLTSASFPDIVIEQLVDYYHTRLMDNKQLLAKVFDLGFTASAVKQLKLGVCDRTLSQIVPSNRDIDGAAIRGTLQVLGLIRGTGHEEFRGCIVLPIRDENGLINAIYGRRMAPYIRRNGRRFVLWLATQDAINTLVFPSDIARLNDDN